MLLVHKVNQQSVLIYNAVLFQVNSKVIQLNIHIYSFFFRLLSHIGDNRILSSDPCATQ